MVSLGAISLLTAQEYEQKTCIQTLKNAYSTAPVRSSWGAAAASSLSLPRPRPFFMHIHIHSRCTIRSCGSLSSFTLGSLTCSSGWQRPTERNEIARLWKRTNGSGINWFRADSWSCSLDYRRKNKRSRLRKWLNLKDRWRPSLTRDQDSLQLAPIAERPEIDWKGAALPPP